MSSIEQAGPEFVAPRVAENMQLRLAFIERSLDSGRWATVVNSVSEANQLIENRALPLLPVVRESLKPYMNHSLDLAPALGRVYDEQTDAIRASGNELAHQAFRRRIGDAIGPKLRHALFQAYRGYPNPNSEFLPHEVYRTLRQMYEATERSITWPATSITPNPLTPLVGLYQQGIIKVKFSNSAFSTNINLHVPIHAGRQKTLLACWGDEEGEVGQLHRWDSDCNEVNYNSKDILYRSTI